MIWVCIYNKPQFETVQMRRKNYKLREFSLQGAKINCASFSKKLGGEEGDSENQKHEYFVTGDTHNNVRFYEFAAEEELINFMTNSSGNVAPEVSAVSVSWDETSIFSGSNRGIINVWDILSAKNTPSCTLKGHATSVNCFGLFPDQDNRIASGSYDTHIKLWDVRTKNNIGMLKHHTKQINSIDVSPDCHYLISGSEDCTTKLWDMRYPQKVVSTYHEHSAPVNRVKFNPDDCMFASCSMDRTAKYFRCEHNHYDFMSSTELVSMPITAIDFNMDGSYLCTAANDVLKIWNMSKNGVLIESIDSAWKGVLDVLWVDKGIKGLASHGGNLSVWFCYLGEKKEQETRLAEQNESKLPKIFKNPSMRREQSKADERKIKNPYPNKSNEYPNNSEEKQKDDKFLQRNKELEEVMNNINFAIGVVNNLDQNKLIGKDKEKEEEKREKEEKKERERQERIEKQKIKDEERKERIRLLKERQKQEKQKKEKEIRQKIERQKEEEELAKQERLKKMQKQRVTREKAFQEKLHETFQKNNNQNLQVTLENDILENSSVMNISAFMGEGVQKEKRVQLELINEFMKDQSRFQSVYKLRSSHVKPIIHYWKQGKIDSALYTLAQADTPVAYDCISAILHQSKFKTAITPDVGCALLKKLVEIMNNKHSTYVKNAMSFLNDIVMMFKDELIKVKNFNPMTRVDLSREERMAKYDRLTEEMLNVFKQDRLKKYAALKSTENQQLNRIAGELYRNLEEVLQKLIPRGVPDPA